MNVRTIAIGCLLASTGAATFGCVGASSTSGGGGGGGGGSPTSACDQYFDALVASAACTQPLPQSEVARLRPIFEQVCADELALPGTQVTSSYFAACAQAVLAAPCSAFTPAECNDTPAGTLATGASCVDGTQCSSGTCEYTSSSSTDGGTSGESTCGACVATTAEGGSCGQQGDDSCAIGTQCAVGAANPTCVAPTYGAAGATCDGEVALCGAGLFCDMTTMICAAPGGAGAACSTSPECASGLVCSGSACATGATLGATCGTTTACAIGLKCDPTTGACAAVVWGDSGDACDADDPCLVGDCNLSGASGICPDVAANGQPCPTDATSTCDTFSECLDGACALPNSLACR